MEKETLDWTDEDTDDGFRGAVLDLVGLYMTMHQSKLCVRIIIMRLLARAHLHLSGKLPPLTDHAAHVLLYCWVYSDGVTNRDNALSAFAKLLRDHAHIESACIRFFQDAVSDESHAERIILQFLWTIGTAEIVDAYLTQTLFVLVIAVRHCPTIQRAEGSDRMENGTRLVRVVAHACQRQLCSGWNDFDGYDEGVLSLGLNIIA